MAEDTNRSRNGVAFAHPAPGQHLGNLDFLRGFAAFFVVLFHFSTRVSFHDAMYHGYLAVDFFFSLSGVVIYRSYSEKIRTHQIPFKSFLWMRIVRLIPLVVLGNSIAAGIDFFRPGGFAFFEHAKDILITFVLECFLLPIFYKTSLEDGTYPLNGPVWSLFFEIWANLIFFFAAKSNISERLFKILCISSILFMIAAIFYTGTAHLGPHHESFLAGFPRVMASFFLGVLIARYEIAIFPLNRWICAAALFFLTLAPQFHSSLAGSIYDIFGLFVIIPLIVSASCAQKSNVNDKIAEKSGAMSYPLYCIHYPLVRAISTFVRKFNFGSSQNFLVCVVIAGILSIISGFLFRYYDVPVRKALKAFAVVRGRTGSRSQAA